MSQTGHINHWAVEKVGGVIVLIFFASFTYTSSMQLLRSVSVLCSFFLPPKLKPSAISRQWTWRCRKYCERKVVFPFVSTAILTIPAPRPALVNQE